MSPRSSWKKRGEDRLLSWSSAFQGVTNDLLDCARLAAKADRRQSQHGRKLFIAIAPRSMISWENAGMLASGQRSILWSRNYMEVAHGIQLLGHCPPRALDLVASFGERLCALIVAAHLSRFRPARFVDARQFVVTDDEFANANVNFTKTNRAARRFFAELFSPKDLGEFRW